jgi:hypothetical protein
MCERDIKLPPDAAVLSVERVLNSTDTDLYTEAKLGMVDFLTENGIKEQGTVAFFVDALGKQEKPAEVWQENEDQSFPLPIVEQLVETPTDEQRCILAMVYGEKFAGIRFWSEEQLYNRTQEKGMAYTGKPDLQRLCDQGIVHKKDGRYFLEPEFSSLFAEPIISGIEELCQGQGQEYVYKQILPGISELLQMVNIEFNRIFSGKAEKRIEEYLEEKQISNIVLIRFIYDCLGLENKLSEEFDAWMDEESVQDFLQKRFFYPLFKLFSYQNISGQESVPKEIVNEIYYLDDQEHSRERDYQQHLDSGYLQENQDGSISLNPELQAYISGPAEKLIEGDYEKEMRLFFERMCLVEQGVASPAVTGLAVFLLSEQPFPEGFKTWDQDQQWEWVRTNTVEKMFEQLTADDGRPELVGPLLLMMGMHSQRNGKSWSWQEIVNYQWAELYQDDPDLMGLIDKGLINEDEADNLFLNPELLLFTGEVEKIIEKKDLQDLFEKKPLMERKVNLFVNQQQALVLISEGVSSEQLRSSLERYGISNIEAVLEETEAVYQQFFAAGGINELFDQEYDGVVLTELSNPALKVDEEEEIEKFHSPTVQRMMDLAYAVAIKKEFAGLMKRIVKRAGGRFEDLGYTNYEQYLQVSLRPWVYPFSRLLQVGPGIEINHKQKPQLQSRLEGFIDNFYSKHGLNFSHGEIPLS